MATATIQKLAPQTAAHGYVKRSTLSELSRFLSVAVQAAVILFLVQRFNLENDLFQLVMRVGMIGFALHHLLPSKLKLPFFVALSIGAIAYCVGIEQGVWKLDRSLQRFGLFAIFGGTLIGICHLPLTYGVRVALLGGTATLLATVRGGWLPLPAFDSVWPVFSAMFMFRTTCYIYDLSTEKKRPSIWHTLGYFLLFPNLWLYVAPVVDLKSFLKSHFNADPYAIYQKGLLWIVRGVFQLLIWRLIYYHFYVDPARVANGAELGQYLLGNVGLYLRLSGQFHIMTGLLHLFGFNLPDTHRRYFLASSFLDYWRRINIYWRDFIAKLFYFPLVVRFKKLGTTGSILAATSVSFFLTWILHPYQFFWIRGTLPLEAKDALFWGLLCVLVCINSIRDLGTTSKKTIAKSGLTWPTTFKTAASTAVTFMVITLLWSIWTSDSLAQWVDLWSKADVLTGAYCMGAMTAIFAATLVFEGPGAERVAKLWKRQVEQGSVSGWRQAFAYCLVPAAIMVGLTTSRVYSRVLSAEGEAILESVFKNTPNKSDEEFMVRGYYESLADTSRFNTLINDGFRSQPPDWVKLEDTDAVRRVMDLRTKELTPSKSTIVNGKLIRTNSWGMRDDEYSLVRPPSTTRIAVLGASHEMGYGVNNGEVFSDVLEARLNNASSTSGRVELMNFAVNHYSPLAQVEVVKRKVLRFRPDALLLFAHQEDINVVMRLFAQALRQGVHPEYPFLQNLAQQAGINEKTQRFIAERKLMPLWPSMIEWAYQQIAADCKANGIKPVWVLQQGVYHQGMSDSARQLQNFAMAAGFTIIRMEDVFQGADPATLIVAPWDTHPNAEGHRLIANGLERRLRDLKLIGR